MSVSSAFVVAYRRVVAVLCDDLPATLQYGMHRIVRLVAPSVLVRLLYIPPQLPQHIPPVLSRMWALPNKECHDRVWTINWRNALHAALAAKQAYPNDALIRRHCRQVILKHNALFPS